MNKIILAADIGATKTNLGLFQPLTGAPERVTVCSFKSCAEGEFVRRVKEFLASNLGSRELGAVCFGVAGPVVDGVVDATNLGLKLSEKTLQAELNCATLSLVNDLYATAASVTGLANSDIAVLQVGAGAVIDPAATAAILAPGTGLGMAFLLDRKKIKILSSEGGHADFSPRDEDEVELWRYLKRRYGRVSRERVLCGPGLVNVFDWLRQRKSAPPSRDIPLLVQSGADVVAAADAGNRLAREAVLRFISMLGGVASDLALTGLAAGGLYLAGGIPAKIIDYLHQGPFLDAFNAKGRMSLWLEQVPVKVILNPEAALLGAARIAQDRHGLLA